jgi:hypothetical protein
MKYSYRISAGKYCILNELVDIPTETEFNFQGVHGIIVQCKSSSLYYVKFFAENVQNMINDQITNSCFPSMIELNVYVNNIFFGEVLIKQSVFNAIYNFVDTAGI